MNSFQKYIILLAIILFPSYGSSSSIRVKLDSILNIARTTNNDSLSVACYSKVGRRIKHFTYTEAKGIIKEGILKSESSGIKSEAAFWLRFADISIEFQNYTSDSCIQLIHKIYPLVNQLNYKVNLTTVRHLGNLHKDMLRFDSAIYYYDIGIKIAQKNSDTLQLVNLNSLIAIAYMEGGNIDIGLEKVTEIEKNYQNPSKSPYYQRAVVLINNAAGNYQKTIDFFYKFKNNHTDTIMALRYATVTYSYPEALYQQGKIAAALKAASLYMPIHRASNRKFSTRFHLTTMGKCYLSLGNYQKALDAINEAYQNLYATETTVTLATLAKAKCEAFIGLDLKDSAQEYLKKYVALEKQEALNRAKIKYQQTLVAYQTKEIENKVELMAKKAEVDKNKFYYFLLIGVLLLIGICIALFAYFRRKQEKTKRALIEAELTSIRSQMNPHFMFNALNSIKSYIIKEEPRKAAEYLSRFAQLIRRILDLSSKKRISLKEELETLDLYVAMEKVRFQNKFEYRIQSRIDVSPHETLVPPLFLQPFLENAIKNGLSPLSDKKGLLELIITQVDDKIEFKLRDNGISQQGKGDSKKSKGVNLSLHRIKVWNNDSDIKNHLEITELAPNDTDNLSGTEVKIELQIKSKVILSNSY